MNDYFPELENIEKEFDSLIKVEVKRGLEYDAGVIFNYRFDFINFDEVKIFYRHHIEHFIFFVSKFVNNMSLVYTDLLPLSLTDSSIDRAHYPQQNYLNSKIPFRVFVQYKDKKLVYVAQALIKGEYNASSTSSC